MNGDWVGVVSQIRSKDRALSEYPNRKVRGVSLSLRIMKVKQGMGVELSALIMQVQALTLETNIVWHV